MQIKQKHLFPLVVIFLFFISIWFLYSVVTDKTTLTKRYIFNTKEFLLNRMSAKRSNEDLSNYFVPRFKNGLLKLSDNSWQGEPVLLIARCKVVGTHGFSPVCLILWMEKSFSISGIYIQNKNGINNIYDNLIQWTDEEKQKEIDYVRSKLILFNLNQAYLWEDQEYKKSLIDSGYPSISLSFDTFYEGFKIGLIDKNGYKYEPIEAYIPIEDLSQYTLKDDL